VSPRGAVVLPDVLAPNLAVVFCGSAVGRQSAAAAAYYAGPGNRFWTTLHEVGLTPSRFDPHEYHRVIEHGIGLTDLAKYRAGGDWELADADDDVVGLERKIEAFAPRALAFNGKRAARRVLGRAVGYGPQPERIGGSWTTVLPSTSGAARRYWNIAEWRALAAKVTPQPRGAS
jgi:TDG/mug DNA glycosylase family protein